jgi:hypothetical protein
VAPLTPTCELPRPIRHPYTLRGPEPENGNRVQ